MVGDDGADANEYDDTDVSNDITIAGSVLKSIENAMSDGSLSGGANKVIGRFTLTFDNGGNRLPTNAALKAQLNDIDPTVTENVDALGAVNVYIQGTTTKTAAGAGAGANLTDSGFVNGTVTLVFEAASLTTSGDQFINVAFDLSGGELSFYSDGQGGDEITDPLLNYTDVTGGTLSN
jgi:hypothetical protein